MVRGFRFRLHHQNHPSAWITQCTTRVGGHDDDDAREATKGVYVWEKRTLPQHPHPEYRVLDVNGRAA